MSVVMHTIHMPFYLSYFLSCRLGAWLPAWRHQISTHAETTVVAAALLVLLVLQIGIRGGTRRHGPKVKVITLPFYTMSTLMSFQYRSPLCVSCPLEEQLRV